MRAVCIAVGQELLSEAVMEQYRQLLSAPLQPYGITPLCETAGDATPEALLTAVQDACLRSECVFLLGRDPCRDPAVLHVLQHCEASALGFLGEDGRPVGFSALCGNAPLFGLDPEQPQAALLLREQLLPCLNRREEGCIVTRTVGVFGLSETAAAERLADLFLCEEARITLYPAECELQIALTASAAEREAALEILNPLMQSIDDRLGVFVYGTDTVDLPHRVVALLQEKHLKIATAESCTAGTLSGRLTEVPGVSSVFECGVAAYSKEIKHSVLHVPKEILDTCGAVSLETARAMADGARRLGEASFGVAITGVAGPEPSEGKPTGTVYIALADAKHVWVKQLMEGGADRERIRALATANALDLTRRYLEALPALMAGSQPLEAPADPIETAAPTGKRSLADWLLIGRAVSPKARLRRIALWLTALLLVVGVGLYTYASLYRPYRNRLMYESLENLYTGSGLSNTLNAAQTALLPSGMLPQFYTLYSRNSDIRGWIRIPNTGISYPVMGGAFAQYYATHNFEFESSDYGVPYFDSSVNLSSDAEQNSRLIIYGNNTRSGQMFSDLLQYRRLSYLREHPLIEMNTIYANGRYAVFAVLYVDSADNYREFAYAGAASTDAEERARYLNELRRRSLFTVNLEVGASDTLLLLSTDASSELGLSTGEIVIAARRLSEEENRLYGDNAEAVASFPDIRENHAAVLPRALTPRAPTEAVLTPATTTPTTSASSRTSTTVTTTTTASATTSTSVSSDSASSSTSSEAGTPPTTGKTETQPAAASATSDAESDSSDSRFNAPPTAATGASPEDSGTDRTSLSERNDSDKPS